MSASDLELLLEEILDADVEEMGKPYPGNHLYKFYGPERKDFFSTPRIRFTVRNSLNDPFELSRRWNIFISDNTIARLSNYLERSLENRLSNPDCLADQILKRVKVPAGLSIDDFRRIIIDQFINGGGRDIVKSEIGSIRTKNREIFESVRVQWPRALDGFVSSTGIFSATELLDDSRLWGLYANSGRGFAVELNVGHCFFTGSDNRGNVFRRVNYTDLDIDELFRNPYYLFLVKDEGWSFEKEWRALRAVADCDMKISPEIHLWDLPPKAIASIIFGYNCADELIKCGTSAMIDFNSDIIFRKAIVNDDRRSIKIVEM